MRFVNLSALTLFAVLLVAMHGHAAGRPNPSMHALKEEGLLQLTQTNFAGAAQAHSLLLVHFWQPGCARCRTLHRAFVEAASTLRANATGGDASGDGVGGARGAAGALVGKSACS